MEGKITGDLTCHNEKFTSNKLETIYRESNEITE